MLRALFVAISLAISCAVAPAAFAAEPVTAGSTRSEITTQLPRTARPDHYRVEITPHAEQLRFDGKLSIDLEVLQPTNTIVLQAAGMRFGRSQLQPAGGGKAMATMVSVDETNQTASFGVAAPLAPRRYRLSIDYNGTINAQANGLFALDYPVADGSKKRGLFTQFENSDARRFIPSWDEPGFKAAFDLTVNVPAAELAVSNMPVTSTKALGKGLKQVVAKIKAFVDVYIAPTSRRDAEMVIAGIQTKLRLREERKPRVNAWLKVRGY